MRELILRESALFRRLVRCVKADNLANQQSIRYAVRNIEVRTEFMRHRVADAQKRIRKRHTGQRRRRMNFLAGIRVCCRIRGRQIVKHQFAGFQRQAARIFGRH